MPTSSYEGKSHLYVAGGYLTTALSLIPQRLFDWVVGTNVHGRRNSKIPPRTWRREKYAGNGEGSVLVFPGWHVDIETMEPLYDLFERDVIVHQLPDSVVSSDLQGSIDEFTLMEERIEDDLGDARSVVCMSMGTTLGFYAANRVAEMYPGQLEDLVAIQTGIGTASAVFNCAITKHIVADLMAKYPHETPAEARRLAQKDLEEATGQYDPVRNLKHLAKTPTNGMKPRVSIFEGMADGVISPVGEQIFPLLAAMRAGGVDYNIDFQQKCGHYSILPHTVKALQNGRSDLLGPREA